MSLHAPALCAQTSGQPQDGSTETPSSRTRASCAAHPTLRRPSLPSFIALSTPDPGSSKHASSRERFRPGDRHGGDDDALGRWNGGLLEVVDETEFDAAREVVGVGSPSESEVECGDCWAADEARNSSQSLLAVLAVVIRSEGEHTSGYMRRGEDVPSSCAVPCGEPGHSNDETSAVAAVLFNRSINMFVVCGPGREPNMPFRPPPPGKVPPPC